MKVYFYHTQDIQRIVREYAEGKMPAHLLYGALHLKDEGIDVQWHHSPKASVFISRWRLILHTTWQVLRHAWDCDAIYATHYKGLDLIILLRALGLFPKPIVVWHHQPMLRQTSWVKRQLARIFYRGMDRLVFFSDTLLRQSLSTPAARRERMSVGCWGPDLDYYDQWMGRSRHGFISTGKEMRDFGTLTAAFAKVPEAQLDIYTYRNFCELDYSSAMVPAPNIHVNFVHGLIPHELCAHVAQAACVAVCCIKSRYTVGLTTVVEALGLGLPLICSRNTTMPFDMERDGIGIAVEYGDVEGWRKAIGYVNTHPEEAADMGRQARLLAETRYNDRLCARHIATLLNKNQ